MKTKIFVISLLLLTASYSYAITPFTSGAIEGRQNMVYYPFSSDLNYTYISPNLLSADLNFDNVTQAYIGNDGYGNVLMSYPESDAIDAESALDEESYFTLTLEADSPINLDSLVFEAGKGGSADPRGFFIRSSIDNYTNNIYSETFPSGAQQAPARYSIPLDGSYEGITSVTFRYYIFTPDNYDYSVDWRYFSVVYGEASGETISPEDNPAEITNVMSASGGDDNISYKWQSSSDADFTSPSDISGATSASYDPPSAPTQTTWYRRLAKDGTGDFTASDGIWKITIVQPGLWTGTTSTDWHTSSNWDDGNVPTSTVDVTIPDVSGTSGNFPTVSSNASCQSLTIQSGANLTVSSDNTLAVSENFTNNGTFIPGNGTVTLTGDSQALNGDITFHNLTKAVSSAAALTCQAEKTITVNGTLTLNGAVANLLSLRSSTDGTQWKINPSGTRTLSYLNVKDSYNTNSTAIDVSSCNCVNSGNNTNWIFAPVTFYVDSTKADDSGDGLSWDNAKQTLQAALDLATSGDQIWVKAGTYFPTSAYDLTNTSRYYHFRMKNGVEIYGGFSGTESALGERNIADNPTILSGDLNEDDVYSGTGQTLTATSTTENCYHVFYHPNTMTPLLDSTAVLDGFIIKGGAAIASPPHNLGGAIYNKSNSPLIRNCRIEHNRASSGGGISNYSSSPRIINTLIINNLTSTAGGSVYNCSNSAPEFINCTVSGNRANWGGGFYQDASSSTLNNCIVYNNYVTASTNGGKEFYLQGSGTTTLNYTCYSNNSNDVYKQDGTFTATNNNINTNPSFVEPASGDFRIYDISPCADVGNDAYNSETTDIRGSGFGRKLEKTTGNAGTIDMGAYEYKYGTDPVSDPEIDIQGNYLSIVNGDDSPSLTDHTDFDSVSISYDSQQRTYTIHNTGTGTLYLGTPTEKNAAASTIEIPAEIVTISGDHSDDFTVTTQPASSVAAGDSTTFVVEFDPSATGTRSATVNVTNNDSDENPFSFAVQGLGTTPEIDVRGNYLSIADGDTTPSAEDSTSFGSAAVDDGTINRTFRIFNTGNETLNIGLRESSVDLNEFSEENSGPSEIVFINGTHADDFSVTEQPDSHSIQPGDSVSFTVQFDPAAGGTRTANIYFFNNDSDEENYNFYISGIGITPPTVTTATFDSITVISAVGGGNVTNNGGASVTAKGVCWGLAENPTIDSSHTSNGTGTGEFTSSLTGLAHGTTYHVRAYATNSAGTGYGPDSTFTTEEIIVSITPSDTLLKGGQEVTYTVSIANVLPAMRGFSVQVDFNADHFTSPSFTEGTYLSSVGTTHWDASGSDGSYFIDCALLGTTDGVTGDGTLFTIQLTTAEAVTDSLVDPESANLALSNATLRDVDNAAITCDQSNGATIVIDTAPPTMEDMAEADSVWYRSQPTASNFGFDDNYALRCVGYKMNDGDWEVIKDDITGTEYNSDGIGLPEYSGLAERTAVHTIYFYAVDDAMNRAGYDDSSWHFSFYKDETAPVGDLGITFTNVATTGMNVVGAAFEDATQGEEYYQFDCTTGETFDRARTLADSIHECTSMTPNTQYTFKYQVSDGVADPNASPAWNATAWSTEYSKYTLSVAPTTETVTCDKSGTISTTTLRFTAVGGFGAGKIEYYRYVLDDSATHTWTGSETQWSSGTLMLGIPTANTNYYLHVKGYNGEDVANGTLALGPYQWDGTPINPVTELNFNATGGDSNSISMDWTNPENDAHGIEIWLKGYGTYPQYVGSVPDFPSTPTEASNDGWTKAHDSLTTSHTSTPAGRNFYYCAIFVKDLVSHYSAAVIDSSLSYWLGDVNEAPDGQVNASDIAIMASAYQTSSGNDNWNAVCDVGPTLDYARISRPVPDDAINFEDLMVFAMNYENTGDDEKKTDKSKSKTTINPIVLKLNIQKVGTQFVAQLQMDENDGHVKGLYVPITFGTDLSFTQVRQGNLVSGSDFFDARQEGNTVFISTAALQNGDVFSGNGVIAEILFTVNGAETAIQFGDAQARTASNADIELTYNYTDVALLTEGLVPTEYKLHQNYPNPFNPSTTIMYDLKESGRVKITLFNINGQRIATMLNQVKDAGYHSFVYEAGNLPSGVYIYQIEVNDFRDVRKLVLMK